MAANASSLAPPICTPASVVYLCRSRGPTPRASLHYGCLSSHSQGPRVL